jgi:hypothetical protein
MLYQQRGTQKRTGSHPAAEYRTSPQQSALFYFIVRLMAFRNIKVLVYSVMPPGPANAVCGHCIFSWRQPFDP